MVVRLPGAHTGDVLFKLVISQLIDYCCPYELVTAVVIAAKVLQLLPARPGCEPTITLK